MTVDGGVPSGEDQFTAKFMSSTTVELGAAPSLSRTQAATTAAIPWVLPAVLFASTSVIVGVIWDVSWHSSIGRDTFWSPPHMAIYVGGLVAGLACAWLALKTTLAGSDAERAAAVSFWGFRAPLGAWVCLWGAFAMLTSAPFDDWWHNTYGLDVKILSPPHVLLASGIIAIQVGAMLMVLASQNRSHESGDRDGQRLSLMFVYAAGLIVVTVAGVASEYQTRAMMHLPLYYQVACGVYPLLLVSTARASKLQWPATMVAGTYMMVVLIMLWVLPFFPATPLLGPIYNPITHMVPPRFPTLIIVPALAIDLTLRYLGGIKRWRLALVLGFVFLLVFLAAQWNFAEFLMSPWARNRVFAAHMFNYAVPPTSLARQFKLIEHGPLGPQMNGLLIALGLSMASSLAGLWWGAWMRRVQR
jgi:uncharacterized membrane protein YhdT